MKSVDFAWSSVASVALFTLQGLIHISSFPPDLISLLRLFIFMFQVTHIWHQRRRTSALNTSRATSNVTFVPWNKNQNITFVQQAFGEKKTDYTAARMFISRMICCREQSVLCWWVDWLPIVLNCRALSPHRHTWLIIMKNDFMTFFILHNS